jgi:cyanophycin synthetase
VKAVIPETVHENGYAILNADDDLVYEMHSRVSCKVAYFSLNRENPRIQAQLQAGGLVGLLEDGFITIYQGSNKIQVAKAAEVPLTFSGAATYMIQNILPAVLSSYIQGFNLDTIRKALQTFIPSPEMTPGRLNVFEFKNFRFMVDYAHNPAGLQAVGDFLKNLNDHPKVGIITGVGDRRDEDITEIGRIAAQIFDEVVIRLDKDSRDRDDEEIVALVKKGIAEVQPSKKHTVIHTEVEAIAYTIKHAKPGSFIVDCSEKISEAIAVVKHFQQQETEPQTAVEDNIEQVYQNAPMAG